jgi:hypothetical protein
MSLTFTQMERITLDVLMGVLPPANESLELSEARRIATIECAEIKAKGGMVTFPTDWDADEEATVEASEPDKGGGGIPCGDSFISPDKECRLGEGAAGGAGREEGKLPALDWKQKLDYDTLHAAAMSCPSDPGGEKQCHEALGLVEDLLTNKSTDAMKAGTKLYKWDESKWDAVGKLIGEDFASGKIGGLNLGATVKDVLEEIQNGHMNGHSWATFDGHAIDPHLESRGVSQGMIQKATDYLAGVYVKAGIQPVTVGSVPEGHHPSGLKKLTLMDNSKWANNSVGKARTAMIAAYEDLAAKGDFNSLAKLRPKAMDKPPDKLLYFDKRVIAAYNKAYIQASAKAVEAAKPQPDDILSVANWKKTGGSLGTNPGGTYTDDAGKKWYVKQGYTDAHAKNEVLAAKLYEAAGIPVMPQQLVKFKDGTLGIAHPWVDDLKHFDVKDSGQHKDAKLGFAAHAWLANWDAVGAHPQNGVVNHNLAIIGGKVTGVETGGAMQYGGLGAAKPFGDMVSEWKGLRDPKTNPSMAKVFGAMTDSELAASAAHVAAVPDSVVRELVKKFGPADPAENAKLADTIVVRKLAIKSEGASHSAQANLANVSFEEPRPPKPPGDSTGTAVFPPPPKVPNTTGYGLSQKTVEAIQKAIATGHPENVAALVLPPTKVPGSVLSQIHDWHKQVLAVMKQDQKLAVATGAGNAGQAPAFKPSALAAPPVILNVAQGKQYQAMFDAVHKAASTMSPADATAAILAIPSNPDSKVTWGKKFHVYKTTALAAVGGAAPIAGALSVKPKPVALPAPKPVFDPAKLPPPPTYTASSKAHVNADNTAIMKNLWEAAKMGETATIHSMKFEELVKETGVKTGVMKGFIDHPAAPVKAYYHELVKNIQEQLNPPPPVPKWVDMVEDNPLLQIKTDFKGYSSDIGRYHVLSKAPQHAFDEMAKHPLLKDTNFLDNKYGFVGDFQDIGDAARSEHSKAWGKMTSEQRAAVSTYTQGSYSSMNHALAKGEQGAATALAAAEGLMKVAVPLKEGTFLSRRFEIKGMSLDAAFSSMKAGEGTTWQDTTIMSTSTYKDRWQGEVHLYMKVGPNVRGLSAEVAGGKNKGENEVMLIPNQRINVTSVEKIGGKIFVIATLAPTLAEQCCEGIRKKMKL